MVAGIPESYIRNDILNSNKASHKKKQIKLIDLKK